MKEDNPQHSYARAEIAALTWALDFINENRAESPKGGSKDSHDGSQ